MDTKLKNIKFSGWFQVLAIVVGLMGIIACFYGSIKYTDFEYAVQSDYRKSNVLKNQMYEIKDNLSVLNELKNEDYIKSGAAVAEKELKSKLDEISHKKNDEITFITGKYESLLQRYKTTNVDKYESLIKERDDLINKEKQIYDDKSLTAKDEMIKKKLQKFNEAKHFIENYNGLYYTIVTNGTLSEQEQQFYNTLPYYTKIDDNYEKVYYIGFSENNFNQQVTQYQQRYNRGVQGISMVLGGLTMIFISIAWLMYTAGRTTSSNELQFNFLDRIYLDIGFVITSIIVLICGILASIAIATTISVLAIFPMVIAYFSVTAYAVTFAKRIKSREILHHTLLYKMSKSLIPMLDIPMNSRALTKKIILFLILFLLLFLAGIIFDVILMIIVSEVTNEFFGIIVGFIWFLFVTFCFYKLLVKRVNAIMTLVDGLKKIKDGDCTHNIPASGFYSIDVIADNINNIADGIKLAVDREMKAELMKVELITNVSHDLKTPLTSIITYSDLLSQEDITSEQSKEYIGILKKKSASLKQMVDDLFEISKAQSGSIAVNIERICLNDLITQSLAEYEEEFYNKNLEVILDVPQNKIIVLADGTKMWRVFSNIFNNALKYSLPGTRVYVDVESINANACITVKNIANYPMSFNSSEICERFYRGDKSRTGDGSGLGLAIVKSFMELQNGSCEVSADGDLFKVIFTLPQA